VTYIVIEGVIGVGKTALTDVLGEQFGEASSLRSLRKIRF
jgi:deoxyadenosine/deoxycytidine kinase